MRLKTVRIVELAMWGALIVLIIIAGVMTEGTIISKIFFYFAFADMIAVIIFASLFQRCPHCGDFLRTYGKFCPKCGNELDW